MTQRILIMGLPGSGKTTLAGGIALTEIMTKVGLFWAHERIWNKIGWGRL